MKKLKINAFFLFLILTASLLAGCLDYVSEEDTAFMDKIAEKLKKPGDVVMVSDIHPGDWEFVCPVTDYTHVDKKAAWKLEIIPEKIVFLKNQKDWSALGGMWALAFVYEPNKVEYFRIHPDRFPYRTGDCVQKKNSSLKLVPTTFKNEMPGIEITETQKAE